MKEDRAKPATLHGTASRLMTAGGGFNSCLCEGTFGWVSDTALLSPREDEHNLRVARQRGGLLTCLERGAGGAGCDGPIGFEMHPRKGNIRATDIRVKSGPGLLYL